MWLCSECAVEHYKISDDYDWRKVGIIWIPCDKCGSDPCVMLFDFNDKGDDHDTANGNDVIPRRPSA
jgi:hypothetical protein